MALNRLPSRKSNLGLLIALLLLVIAGMFGLLKCSRPTTLKQGHPKQVPVKSGGDTLDIAIEISPLSFSMSGDTITGLDYELMREMARIHRRPVKFHPFVPLHYATDGLRSGVFDIVISALPSIDRLSDEFLLTDPVFLDREVLVQCSDAPGYISTGEELAGDTVWIAAGSPFRARIENLAAESGDSIHIVEVEGRSAEQLIILVACGQLPRAVVNERIASRMKTMRYHDLDISVPVSFNQFQTWAISKDNPAMRDTLNAWLTDFRDTPAYNAILNRYRPIP